MPATDAAQAAPPPHAHPRSEIDRRHPPAALPPTPSRARAPAPTAAPVPTPCVAAPTAVAAAVAAAPVHPASQLSALEVEVQLDRAANRNRPSHYQWIAGLLEQIAANSAPLVADLQTDQSGVPLFIVAGACPSMFASMQAVMYVSMLGAAAPTLDFWWIKPHHAAPNELEPQTLSKQHAGPHKNDPGRSRAVYAPIASLITSGAVNGGVRFGLAEAAGRTRAFVEDARGGRRYLCLVWQEDWSNPLARNKFIAGKLVYQAEPGAMEYYACPYRIDNETFSMPPGREHAVGSPLPEDWFKIGW